MTHRNVKDPSLSPCCRHYFSAPEVHLREMEELWTDSIILQRVWKSFMDKLLGEWDEIILWVMFHVVLSLEFLRLMYPSRQ